MAEHELNKIVDDDGEVFNLRDSTKQPTADRVTAWGSTPSDTKYPSEKLVKDSLDGKVSDVKIDGTSVVSSGTARIPMASSSTKGVVKVDDAMSSSSTNPVQNKVVNDVLNKRLKKYLSGTDVPSSSEFVCVDIGAPYQSGVDKSQVLLYDVTSFYDGTIVNNDAAYVGFKGFIVGGKPQGFGEVICVEICAKVAYNSSTRTLKSSAPNCGPEIVKRQEDGVDKYYLSIFYDDTLYSGNNVLVGQFMWRKPTNIDVYSYSNGLLATYTPNETYPGREPFWDRVYSWKSNILAAKLDTARKLKTNLARTADSTFDGSADQTNIPVTGTLPVANGGTGKASVTANSYLKGNGTGALVERTYAEVRTDLGLGSVYSKDVPTSGNASTTQVVMGNDTRLSDARTPTAHTHTADASDVVDQQGDSAITDSTDIITTHINGYSSTNKKLYRRNFKDYVWPWIKDKISSVLGLTATSYGGNAATATAFSSGTAKTKFDGIAEGATKVEASSTPGDGSIKINGTSTTVYTHPSQTAYTQVGSSSKVPKITTDSTGHVTEITECDLYASTAEWLIYQYGDEIDYKNVPTFDYGGAYKHRHWFNRRNGDTYQTTGDNPLKEYYFGNRMNGTKGVSLHAEALAFRTIGCDNSANHVFFAKITMSDNGRGCIRFRLTAINANSGNDVMGSCDIMVKLRGSDNDWHIWYTRSLRSTESGANSPTNFLRPIYYSTGSVPNKVIYIGVRKGAFGTGVNVEVIDPSTDDKGVELFDDAFYKGYSLEIDDFNSSVSGTISDASNGGTLAYTTNTTGDTGGSATPVYVDSLGKLKTCDTMLKQDGSNVVTNSDGSGTIAMMFATMPTWTAAPTADTYFIRQDTSGANKFGRVKFSTIYQGIKNKVYGDRLFSSVQLGRGSGNLSGSTSVLEVGVNIPSSWSTLPSGFAVNANLILYVDGGSMSAAKNLDFTLEYLSGSPAAGSGTISYHTLVINPGYANYVTVPFSGTCTHDLAAGATIRIKVDANANTGIKKWAYSYDVQIIY